MYLLAAGYADPQFRGQLKREYPTDTCSIAHESGENASQLSNQEEFDRIMDAHYEGKTIIFLMDGQPYFNVASCFPIANFALGLFHVIEGITSDGSRYGCGGWEFRALRIGIGLAEMTLVGAWIVHGLATLYFNYTFPNSEAIS